MQRVSSWAKSARDACGSVVDNVVFAVNPQAGAERMLTRKIITASEARMSSRDDERDGGYHDKAGRVDGPQRWMGSRLSPDSELEMDLETVRMRSAELYRTTTAGGAIDTKCDHVIGKGFTYRPKIVEQPGIAANVAKGWNTQILGCHNRWARCCDITGRKSLWELCRLQQKSVDYAGESFTIMWAKRRKGQPIPLVLEVIDCERVSTPPVKSGDPFCRMGIQYAPDGSGEILGYWVQTTHPGDTKQVSFKWEFIESERMLHVFEEWFPGQSRGYPWMRRTLSRWRDTEDLDEAAIIAAQLEACSAAFITTTRPTIKASKAAVKTVNGIRMEDVRPGKIQYLDPTESVVFKEPTKSNIVGTLHEWNHRRIAAGIDWPFEFLMKDWRGVSFAGGRLILSGAKIKCEVAQQLVDVAWLAPIADEATMQMVLFRCVDIPLADFQQRPWVYQRHIWTPPAWKYAITPVEDIQANVMAVENNQRTQASVVADNGDDLDEIYDEREYEREQERLRDIEPPDRIAAVAQQGQSGGQTTKSATEKAKEQDSNG